MLWGEIMRQKLLAAFVLIGSFLINFSLVGPSQAIFGLSQCEKVKQQVLVAEKLESFYQAAYQPTNGATFKGMSYADYKYFTEIWSDLIQWEFQMYSYESKNLNCFSSSQRAFIVKVKPKWESLTVISQHGISGSNFPQVSWGSIYSR
jgi:hypothetical protein